MGDPVSKISKKMSKLSVSSKPKKVRRHRCGAKQATAIFVPQFKYYGCAWPKVVGLKADEAEQIIKRGKPDLCVRVVQENELMTMAYHSHRVRVIVDRYNRVVMTPVVG